ncbi:hypothetical protein [Blastococcus montanus]|uniref:hypothetical protein n=1 Tax=Blastococcus montanus TaxID=3144973 RepID=UPI00320A8A69
MLVPLAGPGRKRTVRQGHRTIRLPGGITVTVVPLTGTTPVKVLRAAAYHADLYLLWGETFAPPINKWEFRTPTGSGFYVGMSAALREELRAGVSLQQWSNRQERLDPRLAILIRRAGRPLDPELLRWCETFLIRQLWLRWTMLNTVSSCPTAGSRLTRHQLTYGLWLTERLLHLITGRILPAGAEGTPTGGPIREQLLRLVRTGGPMLTTEIVAVALKRGVPIHNHGDPHATVRRDLATRERDSRGPTRVRHTHIQGPSGRSTSLFYPAWMSRSEAVRAWRVRNNLPVPPPRRSRRSRRSRRRG